MSAPVIIATLIGDDTAQAGNIVSRGRSPVFGLCRALLAAGFDPESRLECYRGTAVALIVKSIGRGAKLITKERDRGGLEIARWEPFPCSPVRPRVPPSAGQAGHQAAEATDDLMGVAWWNRLSDRERKHWMHEAGDTGRAVDAWRTFKRA
jgi:hypothetical protein